MDNPRKVQASPDFASTDLYLRKTKTNINNLFLVIDTFSISSSSRDRPSKKGTSKSRFCEYKSLLYLWKTRININSFTQLMILFQSIYCRNLVVDFSFKYSLWSKSYSYQTSILIISWLDISRHQKLRKQWKRRSWNQAETNLSHFSFTI